MQETFKIRCNNCFAVFKDESEVTIRNGYGEEKEWCPNCNESGCLMDGKFLKDGSLVQERYVYRVPCQAGDFVYACRKCSVGYRIIYGQVTEIYLSRYGIGNEPKVRIKGRGIYKASEVFLALEDAKELLERLNENES